MKTDYLPGLSQVYMQPEDGYHFNSDTVLLGLFLGEQKGKTVLDIGTAGGALLCYAAAKGAKLLSGIDCNNEALKYAKMNIPGAKLQLIDFRDFVCPEVDTILCNPPFYSDQVRKNEVLAWALNQENMPLKELFGKVRSLLKSNGSFYIIYPALALNIMLKAAHQNDFSLIKLRFVYDTQKTQAIRVLGKFKRGSCGECVTEKPIFLRQGKIEERDGVYFKSN